MKNSGFDYEKFLNPNELKPLLLFSSIFITCYEMFADYVIERPKEMFIGRIDRSGITTNEQYNEKVMSLSKHLLDASLLWFKNMHAIDDEDIEKFHKARKLRNVFAHDFFILFTNSPFEPEEMMEIYHDFIELIAKLTKWWIVEIEMTTNPDLDIPLEDIDFDGIVSGQIMYIKLLTDIAFGDKEESELYYRYYKNPFDEAFNNIHF